MNAPELTRIVKRKTNYDQVPGPQSSYIRGKDHERGEFLCLPWQKHFMSTQGSRGRIVNNRSWVRSRNWIVLTGSEIYGKKRGEEGSVRTRTGKNKKKGEGKGKYKKRNFQARYRHGMLQNGLMK